MHRKKIIGFVVIGIIGAAIIACIINSIMVAQRYSMVYLTTGEIYVGKLCPLSMILRDSYLLRSVPSAASPSTQDIQLLPLKETVWSPKVLKLNRSQIVFYGPLNDDAQAVKSLMGK